MKKGFFIASGLLFLLGSILIYQSITYNDKKLHVVICDVGQGDAIFIRTPQGSDILIDSGPDDSVLSCLSKHMPFWDKDIEIAILTHPDADHVTGFIDVIKRYKLIYFYTSKVEAKTAVYAQFLKTLKDYKIKRNFLWQKDRFTFDDGLTMETLWPTHEWEEKTVITSGTINSFSVVELLTYKNFRALFTGDVDAAQMEEVASSLPATPSQDSGLRGGRGSINFLKAPHHGSRFGLTSEILDILNPKVAAISVGKNNKYRHPAPETLKILGEKDIKILRTDRDGEIEVVSDGESWGVKK